MGLRKILISLFNSGTTSVPKVTILGIESLTPEERVILKSQYEKLESDISKQSTENRNSLKADADKNNSKCPKCKSKNVNNRIKRTQGEISGESSLYGSSFLGCGTISGRGSLKGSIDTTPVNKCNDCQHEWQIKEVSWRAGDVEMKSIANRVLYFAGALDKAFNKTVDFDPNDLKEKFPTREAKQQALIDELPDNYNLKTIRKDFEGLSIELVKYVVEEALRKSDLWKGEWDRCDKAKLIEFLKLPSLRKKVEQCQN